MNRISRLDVSYQEKLVASFPFKEEETLVFSEKNSKGKTTLIRFLLHALGFKVPSTMRVRMNGFITHLHFYDSDVVLEREGSTFRVVGKNNETRCFDLSNEIDQNKAIAEVFHLESIKLVENILGCLYIDQDDGWSILSSGTQLQNKFSLGEIVLGMSGVDSSGIDGRISTKTKEKQRFEAVRNIAQLAANETRPYDPGEERGKLLSEKARIDMDISNIDRQLRTMESVFARNKNLGDAVDQYRLFINHDGKKFLLTSKDIDHFEPLQLSVESNIRDLKLKRQALKKELGKIQAELDSTSGLVLENDEATKAIFAVKHQAINQETLSVVIDNLGNEIKASQEEKKKMINHACKASDFRREIEYIANRFSIFKDYLDSGKDLINFQNTKGMSGTILHKAAFCYRVAALKVLANNGFVLPLIVDSPGAAEMKIDEILSLLRIAKEELPRHQFILSSVYRDELSSVFDTESPIVMDGTKFSLK